MKKIHRIAGFNFPTLFIEHCSNWQQKAKTIILSNCRDVERLELKTWDILVTETNGKRFVLRHEYFYDFPEVTIDSLQSQEYKYLFLN